LIIISKNEIKSKGIPHVKLVISIIDLTIEDKKIRNILIIL